MSARHLRLIVAALVILVGLWAASRALSHGSDVVAGRVRPSPVDANQDAVALKPRQPALEEDVSRDLVRLEPAIRCNRFDHSLGA